MKISVFCPVAVCLSVALAQWEPDVALTANDSSSHTSFNNVRSIVAGANGSLHVVWYDHVFGTDQIFYKRSTDCGTSWSTDTALTDAAGMKSDPSLAISGDTLHLVWEDGRYGYAREIVYLRSTDNGVTWSTEQRLTNDDYYSRNPAVAALGSLVHVVWSSDTVGRELYYMRSTDNGASWVDRRQLTFDMQESWYPSIAADGPYVHIAWRDWRDHCFEVYYLRSTDQGATWDTSALRLSEDVGTGSYNPCLCASDGHVHVIWWDTRHTPFELYYRRSTDQGTAWQPEQRLTEDTTGSYNPTIIADRANVHVVWEALYGTADIYHVDSRDYGANWQPETRLTNVPYMSVAPSAAVLDSGVHVVWTDFRDNDYGEIYYKRNLTGNTVGIENSREAGHRPRSSTTIARGSMVLAGCEHMWLRDITGRKVVLLHPGPNDLSALAPGIYFTGPGNQRLVKIR